jgi:FkbH-like protein
VTIERMSALTLPRIAQLTTKTNQFNLTTRRYTEAQLLELQAQSCMILAARVQDRFGDLGLTGVAIIRPLPDETWEIDTLLLSCRVMGRGVETALLAHIAAEAHRSGVKQLQGTFLPTAKNAPARDCYPRHGFKAEETDAGDTTLWTLDVEPGVIATPTWLTVQSP